ncbi:response regulator [bacterium]|nr:response regulator [bacterium]
MKKILIVDDEPDILELLSYNLQKEGFETSGLASGEEVLRTVNEEEYNLIILAWRCLVRSKAVSAPLRGSAAAS